MEFRAEAPTAQARRLADREIRNEATSGEVAWLHDHPLLWYRALRRMEMETRIHIFKARTDLSELRAELIVPGRRIPSEYLRAKAAVDKAQRGREHFRSLVDERLEQARSLMGGETVDRWLHGDLIMGFYDIGYAINSNDLPAAREMIQMWITRLSEKEIKREQ